MSDPEAAAPPTETRALVASILGAFVMTIIGVGFSWWSHSDAIMLDGVFSGLGVVMGIITLKVAELVQRPDDEHFHYGYSHFAPLMNVLKSLLMIVLCGFAFLSAVDAILHGGRHLAVGIAVVYGLVSTLGCIAIALYLHRAAQRTGSALVAVDSKAWVIDSILSAAVLASFAAGYLVRETGLDPYLDYLDPTLVAILCALSLPIPLKILVQNAREVLLFAPDAAMQQAVDERFRRAVGGLPIDDYRIRLLKMGDTMNVLIHARPGEGFVLRGVEQFDAIHRNVNEALADLGVKVATDIVLVSDMRLAE